MTSFSVMADAASRPDLQSWSPNIHWARRIHRAIHQIIRRRIYDFELMYVLKGEIRAQVGEQQYRVPTGKMLYLPAGVEHSIEFDAELSVIGVHFDYFGEMTVTDNDGMCVNGEASSEAQFCTEPVIPEGPLFRTHLLTAPVQTVGLIEMIVEEFHAKKAGYELVCRGLLLQILVLLLRQQEEAEKRVHPVYGGAVLQLAKRMEAGCWED